MVIGAGFATGREIKTYFTRYGNQSYLIIAAVAVLLYGAILLLLWMPPGKGKFIAVPYVFFCYVLMLSALGKLIEDYTRLPTIIGILAGTLIAFLGLLAGFSRFTVISGVITPCIATLLVILLVKTGVRPYACNLVDFSTFELVASTVKFVGYNSLSALIVLPEIGHQYTKKEKFIGAGIGVIGFSILIFIINMIFLKNISLVENWEMPLIQAISAGGNILISMFSVSLLCVIIAFSLCGSAVGVSRMLLPGKNEFFIGLVFILLAMPLSLLGFGNLMDNVYPVLGFLGSALIIWFGYKFISVQFIIRD